MTRRIRVVHITGSLDMGGQEKLLVEMGKHANRDRFELHYLSLGSHGLLSAELGNLGWPVTALNLTSGLYPSLPLQLMRWLRRQRIDMVHTHNERPLLYAAPAARLARMAGLIHTKHGQGTRNTPRQNFLLAQAARLTDYFVCVSQDCALLARQQGVPRKRVRVIPNGIDTMSFPNTGSRPGGPAVMVARLCPDKDHDTLLHAVAILVRELPEFRLLIAGDGPCLEELQRLSEHLHLGQHVHFLGMVHDVPALLQTARMKVLSSVSEGMALTLLEAMATGLPVVATRAGGTSEVVLDGITGLLVPTRNPIALASSLLQLQRDANLAHRLGQAGRQRVEQEFNIRSMVAHYEQMYQEVQRGTGPENQEDRREISWPDLLQRKIAET